MSQICKSNNNKVYRLVLTGGPSGGKTTGQARLSTFFESLGWRVYRVPQILSAISGGGVEAADTEKSEEISYRFYENLLKLTLQVENTYFEIASTSADNCLIICDGGTMDIRARLSAEQWTRVTSENGWNDVGLRDSRYNQVIHMVSQAASDNKLSNSYIATHGATDVSEARRQDKIVSQAWVGHPYYDVVDNSTEFDLKIKRMISAVCYRLNIHIGDRLAVDSHKRKFLVSKVPDPELFPQFQDFVVVHDYLASPDQKMQARVRRRGQNGSVHTETTPDADLITPVTPVGCIRLDFNQQGSPRVFIVGTDADLNNWTYTHTIRCSQSDVQDADNPELKMQISAREYELLLGQKDAEHMTVYKTRRCFLWNNQYFQLDIYKEPFPPRCRGLIMLETYTALKGSDFQLPSFLEVVKEVTGNPEYSMYNLSKKMAPESGVVIEAAAENNCKAKNDRISTTKTLNNQPVNAASEHKHKLSSDRSENCKSDRQLRNGFDNALITSCIYDKFSKWSEAKRGPGFDAFSHAMG